MIRRSLATAAALSLALSSVAAHAAPAVRPQAATVAPVPLPAVSAGDRVGAGMPDDASELAGSTLFILIFIAVAASAVIIVAGAEGTSP